MYKNQIAKVGGLGRKIENNNRPEKKEDNFNRFNENGQIKKIVNYNSSSSPSSAAPSASLTLTKFPNSGHWNRTTQG